MTTETIVYSMTDFNDFTNKKIGLIVNYFDFLTKQYGFDSPIIEFNALGVMVIYINPDVKRKVRLVHDFKEKHFYFTITNGAQIDEDAKSSNVRTFLQIFQHANKSITMEDVQPGFYEASENKLRKNAELLQQLGGGVLSGEWF